MRRIPTSIYPLALGLLLFSNCRKAETDLTSLPVTGLIEAVQTDIRAQVQGEVREVLVQEGQPVRQGDYVKQGDVAFAPLDPADIIAVQVRKLR